VSCEPERVTGYVDDALEPAERQGMEAHLEECAACREQAAAERELRARLNVMPLPEPPAGLEEEVRRRLRPRRPRRSWRLALAAGLVLFALWLRGSASFVAWELARDHAHCFGRDRLPAKIWTSDPVEAARWLEGQGTRVPPLPAGVENLGLVGVRYCTLLDRSAAHLYYANEDRQLSLFVLAGPARFGDAWRTSSRGHAVRLLRSAGATVAVVSTKKEDADAFAATFARTVAELSASP
jgi:anti-sigma factor RsiW